MSTTERSGRRFAAAFGFACVVVTVGACNSDARVVAEEAPPPEASGDSAPTGELPAAGRFLVATEKIRGSIFHESVVYLVSYSESGALGLIVNKPIDVALHEVVEGAVEGSGTLYVGGPVETSKVMMLLRADEPPEHSSSVADDVFISADREVLLAQTAKLESGRLRVYAGYAGWQPKQLDGEIARGQWLVVSASSDAIFAEKPDGLWEKFHRRFHRLVAQAKRSRDAALRS